MVKVLNKIGSHASNKKRLKSLANKCEALSREYTKLRDKSCVCGCGKTTGLDWAHGISRKRERFKYHPNNTFRMHHECHLAMDQSPIKSVILNNLMNNRLGPIEWQLMLLEAMTIFRPTEEFYNNQIEQLQTLIAEVNNDLY